jgi:hypothetical protein
LYLSDAWEQKCTFKSEDKEALHACIKKFKEFIGLYYIKVDEMEVDYFLNEAQTLEIAKSFGVATAA